MFAETSCLCSERKRSLLPISSSFCHLTVLWSILSSYLKNGLETFPRSSTAAPVTLWLQNNPRNQELFIASLLPPRWDLTFAAANPHSKGCRVNDGFSGEVFFLLPVMFSCPSLIILRIYLYLFSAVRQHVWKWSFQLMFSRKCQCVPEWGPHRTRTPRLILKWPTTYTWPEMNLKQLLIRFYCIRSLTASHSLKCCLLLLSRL